MFFLNLNVHNKIKNILLLVSNKIEKQVWKLSSDLRTFHYTEYDNNDKEISSSNIKTNYIFYWYFLI